MIVRAAVAQVGTLQFDLQRTLTKLQEYVEKAAAQGCRLIVFPEAYIGGYPRNSTFGAVVGQRSPEGREEFLKYYQGAIAVPGPVTDQLAEIAARYDIFLVVGVIEREPTGTLYCTAVFVDPKRGYLAKHRKVMPTGSERLIWGFGDGSTLPVVENEDGARIAAAICWENYMPLLRANYFAQGVQIYCAPTVDARQEWTSSMQHIALEGRCFVLSACQLTRQKDYPEYHPLPEPKDPEAIMIGGGSVIVSPLGKILAGPAREQEALLVADLDLDDVIRGKFDLDSAGHYARPDIFSLVVNEKPQINKSTK